MIVSKDLMNFTDAILPICMQIHRLEAGLRFSEGDVKSCKRIDAEDGYHQRRSSIFGLKQRRQP
ncbi:hypothetical protein F2Q70_00006348 [Brassica cretica]|uniref:Uncharacterized protein n=1 Tax=Brassica cretica TaxID=69181 RepID=A0A8S9ISI3_BRACR|nr:hypothetical protein F2Q70_00006348 [Brassica cretica]